MGEGGGIDDQGVGLNPGFLNPVDQLAFVIRLPEDDARAVGRRLAHGLHVGQGFMAIDIRLPNPEQVQVGAVQDVEGQGFGHSLAKQARHVRAESSARCSSGDARRKAGR
ncbi:hypothetical protein D3C80_1780350 [compost metagenome]